MAKYSTYYHKGYGGGLNDSDSAREIDRDEASLLRNWDITFEGQLYRRDGLTQAGDTQSNEIKTLHSYVQTDGSEDLLIFEGGVFRYLNSSTFDAIDNAFTDEDVDMENCPLTDDVYISSKSNTIHSWDRGAVNGSIAAASFTGTGLDDATSGGDYIGGGQTYRVKIDGTGTPDTFTWSDDGGSTWEATGVAITGSAQTLSNGVTVTFAATTGHTADDYWDLVCTSALTDLGADVPHGNVLKWHKNHMFTANQATVSGTTYPNRVYWSALGDPTTWDTTNDYIQVPGGGNVVGLGDLGNALVIFKEHAIFYMTGWGDSDWQISASSSNVAGLSEAVGCLGKRAMTRVGNEIWFMDDEGQIRRIYQTDFDAYRTDMVSTKIQGTLSGINSTKLSEVVAFAANDKVYFAVPDGASTTNDLVLVFDLIASKRNGGSEAWTTYTGWEPNDFTSRPASGGNVEMYMADVNGKVYQHTGDDDDGAAIDARWDGKDDDYDEPEKWKRYAFGYITGEASADIDIAVHGQVDQSSFANFGDLNLTAFGGTLGPTGTFELGPTGTTAILSGGGTNEFKFYYSSGGGGTSGKRIMHSIRHNTASEQPTVNTLTSHFKAKRLR